MKTIDANVHDEADMGNAWNKCYQNANSIGVRSGLTSTAIQCFMNDLRTRLDMFESCRVLTSVDGGDGGATSSFINTSP